MIPQLTGPAKGRRCSETCLDLLAIQLVRYYQKQNLAPAAASIEAIGNVEQSMLPGGSVCGLLGHSRT